MKRRVTIKGVAREVIRANPPFMNTVYTYVAPAAAGYALTRAAGWAAFKLVENRKPGWSKAAFTTSQLAVLYAIYHVTTKYKRLNKYQVAAVTGAGVAVAQAAICMLFPKLAKYLGIGMPTALMQPPMTQAELKAAQEEFDEYGSLGKMETPVSRPSPRKITVTVPTIPAQSASTEDVSDIPLPPGADIDGEEPEDDGDTTWGIN